MSGASRRLHEEASHPSASKRAREGNSLSPSHSGKVIQSSASDWYQPYRPDQVGRLTKVQRIEHSDSDTRSSLLHRMSFSSSTSRLDHLITSDNKIVLKEIRDDPDNKAENREMEPESRDLYSGTRMDCEVSKDDGDTRPRSTAGERELRSDTESDVQFHKDRYGAKSSHLNREDHTEHQRPKKYSEIPSDALDSRYDARLSLHSIDEVGDNCLGADGKGFVEAHQAVCENKTDSKGKENSREKSKMKDEKHQDQKEKCNDGNDHRNSLRLGCTSNECMELVREERVVERRETERKDAQKHKERRDGRREFIIEDPEDANEKESPHTEKDLVNVSSKIVKQESTTSKPNGLTDDSLKAFNRNFKDRKGERDVSLLERHEKHGHSYDKELDGECAQGNGVTEKDKEASGYSAYQGRMMLQSQGSPHPPNQNTRFRFGARENGGSRVKSEASTIVYKPGKCMHEVHKSWTEFEESKDSKNEEKLQNSPTLEIRIPAEYISYENNQVRYSKLWGTDIYTEDSDLVAVLMHTGYCRARKFPPPSRLHELCATICLLPPQDYYIGSVRNNVRSCAWGAGACFSFRVEGCCILKKDGRAIHLEPCLTQISTAESSLAPMYVENTMTTRAAASNASYRQRFVEEVTIQYNLCNEPWFKYSNMIIADKGLNKSLYTSARLKKGEVLYLETHFIRYELCFNGEKALGNGTVTTPSYASEVLQENLQNHNLHTQTCDRDLADHENIIDTFRWSRCKNPLPQEVMLSYGIPLPLEHLEVLEDNLDWEDIQWSKKGVTIAGKDYALVRVHFLSAN